MLSGIAELGNAPTEDQARLVVGLLPKLQPSMSPREIRFFEAVVGLRSREEKRTIPKKARRGILAMVSRRKTGLEAMIVEQHRAAGIEGLREAVDSGVLEVHPFHQTSAKALVEATVYGGGSPLHGVDLADLLEEFVAQVRGAAEDGSTYPLFDDPTGDFVAEAIRGGLIRASEASAARGRYGGLSGDLLKRLPLFEEATIAEVLDVRRELEGPLQGFRAAVSDFSGQVRSAAWDPGFPEEADALFREKVRPEVERIGEDVRENRSIGELARRLVRHGATRAAFGALIGSVSDFGALSGCAMGLGSAGVQALLDRHARSREIRGNGLYFYFGAAESLENAVGRIR